MSRNQSRAWALRVIGGANFYFLWRYPLMEGIFTHLLVLPVFFASVVCFVSSFVTDELFPPRDERPD